MFSWKERLYALLLRRILGPLLLSTTTTTDNNTDHDDVFSYTNIQQVSLSEGSYIFHNILLNTEYINTQFLNDNVDIHMIYCMIHTIQIDIRLVEEEDTTKNTNTSSTTTTTKTSLAWRAWKLLKLQNTTTTASQKATKVQEVPVVEPTSSSSSANTKVSLVVHVRLEGIRIVFEPSTMSKKKPINNHSDNNGATTTTSDNSPNSYTKAIATTTTTFLSSFLEAVLASLRLSMELHDIQIRFQQQQQQQPASASHETKKKFIQLHTKSIFYHDHTQLPTIHKPPSTIATVVSSSQLLTFTNDNYHTVVHKILDLSRITIITGWSEEEEQPQQQQLQPDPNNNNDTTAHQQQQRLSPSSTNLYETMVALLDGTSQICFRVVEYNNTMTETNDNTTTPKTQRPSCTTQQDIQMSLHQKLNISVDITSLQCIRAVLHSFMDDASSTTTTTSQPQEQQPPQSTSPLNTSSMVQQQQQQPVNESTDTTNASTPVTPTDQDEVDCQILDTMMKQYREARLLVEQNEIRNGILYPSIEDNGQITFDTFFDANESIVSLQQQQQQRHSSMLKESIMGSMLYASFQHNNNQQSSDWIYRKFTIHLQEGGIKLTLPSSSDNIQHNLQQQYSSAKEYVLVTFYDINLSIQSSNRSSNYTFSMNHFEIEGSLDNSNDVIDDELITEVGTMLRFVPDGDVVDDDDDDDMDLLVQAPCLSVSVNVYTTDKTDTMDWDILMTPIEFSYRSSMVTKLIAFFQIDASNNPPILEKPRHSIISVTANCASLTLLLPLPIMNRDDETCQIYNRAGYVSESTMVRQSALGLVMEHLTSKMRISDTNETTNELTVSCHNIHMFVTTPISRYSAFDHRTHRLNYISIYGRTEIDPCIPISIRYRQFSKIGISGETLDSDRLQAESSFPRVPSISSYKARQEDDDNETTSKATEVDMTLDDPQSAMLSNLVHTNTFVAIHIPEVIVDLSGAEVREIQRLIGSIDTSSTPSTMKTMKPRENVAQPFTTCSVTCESISIFLHAEDSVFALSLEGIKGHCAMDKDTVKQMRVLIHDFDFLEVVTRCQKNVIIEPSTAGERVRLLRRQASTDINFIVQPILYRCTLFTPISPISPSIHLDMFQNLDESQGSPTTTVYLNLYQISYRHQYDCSWIENLSNNLSRNGSTPNTSATASLMRLFISVTDCNVDYASPVTFHTASRVMLRIGDMRLASNLLSPRPLKQAFTCTIANTELLMCCNRFAYNFENKQLISSSDIMKPGDISMELFGLSDEAEAIDVLRLMNYRIMGTVESVNVQFVAAVGARTVSDPALMISASTRQICVFACRDSLARLMDTIGEATAEMTAITTNQLEEWRSKSLNDQLLGRPNVFAGRETAQKIHDKKTSTPSVQRITSINTTDIPFEFLLDGYDWTAIDSDEIGKLEIPQGEEQSARWLVDGETQSSKSSRNVTTTFPRDGNVMKNSLLQMGPPIITHHFSLHSVVDPIGDGDMGATKYANSKIEPRVKVKVIVRDLAIRLRFFDGYDWPELLNDKARSAPRCESFLIPEVKKKAEEDLASDAHQNHFGPKGEVEKSKKSILLEDLLVDGSKVGSTFANIPLPDEYDTRLKEEVEFRRLARRTSKYFQIEASGVVARIDAMEECDDHRLVSCMNLMISDLFIAETISSNMPVKMVGEWFNEQEHPRDSKEGLILMKMVTWHPLNRISPDDKIANDESDVCLKLHPLRCIIDQRAVAFIRAFFNTDNDFGDLPNTVGNVLPPHLYAVPPPLYTTFRVQPLKLKVDYRPQKIDTSALRNGSVVELINLSPLDGMILVLKSVNATNVVGFGAAMSMVVSRWVEDICSTQLHKFVTKARPFEPITEVGAAVTDIVVLPWEAFRNRESITNALKAGAKSFSKVAIYELLNTSSRVANFVGANVSRVSEISSQSRRTGNNLLPDRPVTAPRTIFETGPHALESLSRGLQEANYTIVIVPYREYHKSGPSGAAYSVMRGIPVAIAAPTSGAAEAISYALLGARNQIRPDIRKEDEATFRGLQNPNSLF